MPKGVYPHKPHSEAVLKAQAEAMRQHWASLPAEQRSEIGAKISAANTGKKQSEAHRRVNSESHKGQCPTAEQRLRMSEGLKRAYAEGRKKPVCTHCRKGVVLSEETKAKIRAARAKQVVWNKGTKTGPMPVATRQKIAAALTGRPGATLGQHPSAATRDKLSASQQCAWQTGRRVLSPRSGYGKGSYYQSPYQGKVWLRSTSEVQRARELDAAGVPWFYEAIRFSVLVEGKIRTYTPDFWILPGVIRSTIPLDAISFLRGLPEDQVCIEDVKGWWDSKHPSRVKIEAFQTQYPHLNFSIVIRRGGL